MHNPKLNHLCGLVLACLPQVHEMVDSILSGVTKYVRIGSHCFSSMESTHHIRDIIITGWLGIRIICTNEMTCLLAGFCFCVLSHKNQLVRLKPIKMNE